MRTFLTIVLLLLLAIAAAAAYGWQRFQSPPTKIATGVDTIVTVPSGSGTVQIARRLQDAGLLDHPRLFALAVRLLDSGTGLKAGEYAFTGQESPAMLIERLQAGSVTAYSVSIPEGFTAAMALARLREQEKINWDLDEVTPANLFRQLQQRLPASQWQRLAAATQADVASVHLLSAEGWLFPDTYQFAAAAPASGIIAQSWAQMHRRLDTAWQAQDENLPYAKPYDLLIMASIVEKETGRASDRGQIAQVFTSRLQLGMRLQTDPTVIYGLGETFDGNLRRIHLRTDGPYNSYTRHGLPPTPIALPGAGSLMAAAKPAQGNYLYFVARGDGTSQFSKTLAEHESAVRKYQLKQ